MSPRRPASTGTGYSTGVAVGDYDNDGYEDLFVAGYGRNTLYHNNGDGTFTDVTDNAGVAGSGWSTSAAWVDYDNDGSLDLIVARYMEWDFDDIYCGHREEAIAPIATRICSSPLRSCSITTTATASSPKSRGKAGWIARQGPGRGDRRLRPRWLDGYFHC